jgi:glycerol-3-phosphate acyltransferase PlsY
MLPAILLIAAAAYLLGSIPIGYLLVRFFRQQDIRSVGSGNIGATNVLRYGGKSLGAITFLLDVLKGSGSVFLGTLMAAHLAPALPTRDAQALAALFAVLGTSSPSGLVSTAARE